MVCRLQVALKNKDAASIKDYIPIGVSIEREFFTLIEDARGNENRSKFISTILREYFVKTKKCDFSTGVAQKGLPVDESFDASNQQVRA